MKVSEVLASKKASGSKEPEAEGYDYGKELRGELKSILGVDDAKADRLATVICALAREEISPDEPEAPSGDVSSVLSSARE